MILYLSAPMTGVPRFNYHALYLTSQELQEAGFTTINPAAMDSEEIQEAAWLSATGDPADLPGFDMATTIRDNVEHLLLCDGICLLEGWESSKGALMELAVAERLGLYVGTPEWYTKNASWLNYLNPATLTISYPF